MMVNSTPLKAVTAPAACARRNFQYLSESWIFFRRSVSVRRLRLVPGHTRLRLGLRSRDGWLGPIAEESSSKVRV